jgi:hypothetical protein
VNETASETDIAVTIAIQPLLTVIFLIEFNITTATANFVPCSINWIAEYFPTRLLDVKYPVRLDEKATNGKLNANILSDAADLSSEIQYFAIMSEKKKNKIQTVHPQIKA